MKRLSVETITIQIEEGKPIVFEVPADAQVVSFEHIGIYAIVQYVVPTDLPLSATGLRSK